MAGLLYAGFDYGTTANLPGLWTSAANVTIAPTSGRLSGGAAFFDATLSPLLSKTLTWGDTQAYMGLAVQPVELDALFGARFAQFITTDSTFELVGYGNGALAILQDGAECCAGGPGLFNETGAYVEWSVQLDGAAVTQIRVNGLVVATGALVTITALEAFTTVTLGNGVPSVGQWYVDDVYVLDGVPATPFSFGSRVIDNASFLGDVHVQALFATQEGYHIDTDPGYTPWVAFPSTPHYNKINENPPDDGVTKDSSDVLGTPSAGTLDVYGTYQFTSPLQTTPGYGLRPGGAVPWELFAVQWIGHLQSSGGNTVAPTIREVVDLPSTDQVDVGADLTIPPTVNTYAYQGAIYDRDPLVSLAWTFAAIFLVAGFSPAFGTREFGTAVTS